MLNFLSFLLIQALCKFLFERWIMLSTGRITIHWITSFVLVTLIRLITSSSLQTTGAWKNALRSEYTMKDKDKGCRSVQSITREKKSFLKVFVENTTQNPIVATFSLFECIFCCFLVTQILAMPNPYPRSGIGKVCKIKRWKCFWIPRWISWNKFEKFFATDGTVACYQRTKKLLIPPKVTNKQKDNNNYGNRRQTHHIVQQILSNRKTPLNPCWGERGLFFQMRSSFFLSLGYSSEGTEESDSTVLIILFPVLAGGLLLTLTAVVFIRKLLKKRHEWKPEGLLINHP